MPQRPDQDDRTEIQRAGEQARHPEDRHGRQGEAVGKDVQSLQEADEAKDPQDAQQPDHPENRRVVLHRVAPNDSLQDHVREAHKHDANVEQIPHEVGVVAVEKPLGRQHPDPEGELDREADQQDLLRLVPLEAPRLVGLVADDDGVHNDQRSDENLEDQAVDHLPRDAAEGAIPRAHAVLDSLALGYRLVRVNQARPRGRREDAHVLLRAPAGPAVAVAGGTVGVELAG
mmetsp:Transcript_103074/g.315344  ORF Transcript_103074/g.315344 Transcript_103074/m.315344 type:complete len:230 (+) Transcript_103074:1017-1706(+)